MKLVVGAQQLDRTLHNAERLLDDFFEKDLGRDYYAYAPITPPDCLYPEDLGITLIFNSGAGSEAARTLMNSGSAIDLSLLPSKSLQETDDVERKVVAELITRIANLPGFAASLASKTLHKKRPQLVPVLDNQAIFGAYLNASHRGSVKDFRRIKQAIDWIAFDLVREENKHVWPRLQVITPTHSLIEIFDMIWWMYFRRTKNEQARERMY